MVRIKFKYRNTGFMRQVFVWLRFKNGWKYKGIEFNKRYFRVYKLTNEGVLPKFRDLYGATNKRKLAPTDQSGEDT